jgi:hypothetical protein
MKLAIVSLILSAVALAQEQPPKPIPVYFDNGSIDLMPGLTGGQRYQLKRFFGGPVKQVRDINAKIQKCNQLLGKTRDKNKRAKIVAERRRLQEQFAAKRKQARAAYDKIGIKPEQLERLNRIPRGAMRRERYNHSVMLEAPKLTAKQEQIVRAAIASADGAQRTLVRQREGVDKALIDQDVKVRQRLKAQLNSQVRAVEKRFWQTMYFALTAEQMRATREIRSPRYRNPGDMRNQLYLLPGLTPSQATRINSLLTEMNSETAADNAAINAFNRKLRDKKLPKAERAELQKRVGDAYRRRGKIYQDSYKAIRELLNDEQYAEFESIPPQINAGERNRGPVQTFRGLALRPDQNAAIQKMGAESRREVNAAQKDMREKSKELRESGIGPDSPQMMMMTTMNRGLQGDRARIVRRLGNRLCEEVLDPCQLSDWIASPTLSP